MNVILHADDYGYNIEVSKDIIDCIKEGTLHGISIMPNSPYFDECMEILNDSNVNVSKAIHFSISEGPCLSDKDEVKLLVNENGMFCLSFFKLLLLSIGPKRKELKKELKQEIRAQFIKAKPYLDEINVDSHVHYHMIPLVLKSILEVIKEEGYEINYLRVPAEPLMPFIKNRKIGGFNLVNIIKNIVLNVLAFFDKSMINKYKDKTAVFFGIVMSGHMDIDRVSVLLNDFKKIAERKNMDVEILAHPGRATSTDTLLDPSNTEYSKAPLSELRHIEKKMFMEISKAL